MKKLLLLLALIPLLSHAQCLTPTPPQTLTVTATSPYTVAVHTDHSQLPANGFYAVREQDQNGIFVFDNSGYPGGNYTDDIMLLPNHTFCYKIRAYANCGTHSDYTEEVMVTMPDGLMPYQGSPEPPYNLSAAMSNVKVLLQWTNGAFPAVPGQKQVVQIARSSNGGVSWSQVNVMPQCHSYLDTYSFVSGQTYLYKIRNFNGWGWATGYYGNCTVTNQTCGTAWSNLASIIVP
jgi:hypothetical protein